MGVCWLLHFGSQSIVFMTVIVWLNDDYSCFNHTELKTGWSDFSFPLLLYGLSVSALPCEVYSFCWRTKRDLVSVSSSSKGLDRRMWRDWGASTGREDGSLLKDLPMWKKLAFTESLHGFLVSCWILIDYVCVLGRFACPFQSSQFCQFYYNSYH